MDSSLALWVVLIGFSSGLILPMTKPDGSADMSSIVNHVALFEQMVTSVQSEMKAMSAQIQVLQTQLDNSEKSSADELASVNEELAAVKSELKSAKLNITGLQIENQRLASKLNSSVGHTSQERVMFQVQQKSNEHLKTGSIMNFDTVQVNDGNGYNNYTGIFTAPVSGAYHFWVNIHAAMTTIDYFNLKLLKNDEVLARGHAQGPYDTLSILTATNVKKGDKIWVEMEDQSIDSILGNLFSGFGGVCLFFT